MTPDPSWLALELTKFIDTTTRYSKHAAEIARRRERGELNLVLTFDPAARRPVVHAIAKDGQRARVLDLAFRKKRGWLAVQ